MKKLNVLKIIDQWGWSYDFICREQQRYSKHNIIIKKYDDFCLTDDIDIIYSHSPNISANYQLMHSLPKLSKDRNVKFIGGYAGDPKYWVKKEMQTYTGGDLIVTISPETYKFAKNNYSNIPVIFLPESIDTNMFTKKQFNQDSFVIGWAGSCFPVKRIELLNKLCFPVVKKSDWGSEFFKENRSQSSMVDFFNSIDVFVLTSESECMPRVVLEAMSSGLPVISTNVGCIPMLLQNDWIVPVDPPDLVVEQMNIKLKRLYDDPNLRKKVGDRNRMFAENYFSWSVNQPLWDNVFDNVCSNNIDQISLLSECYLEKYNNLFL